MNEENDFDQRSNSADIETLDIATRLSQLLEVSIWIAQCKLEGRRWWIIATPDGGWRISKDDDEDDEWD